jgi:hypothetical protein
LVCRSFALTWQKYHTSKHCRQDFTRQHSTSGRRLRPLECAHGGARVARATDRRSPARRQNGPRSGNTSARARQPLARRRQKSPKAGIVRGALQFIPQAIAPHFLNFSRILLSTKSWELSFEGRTLPLFSASTRSIRSRNSRSRVACTTSSVLLLFSLLFSLLSWLLSGLSFDIRSPHISTHRLVASREDTTWFLLKHPCPIPGVPKKVRASALLFGPRRSAPHRGAWLVLFVGPRRSAQHRGAWLVLFVGPRRSAQHRGSSLVFTRLRLTAA